MIDSIRIGDLFFEYDADRSEMYVGCGETVGGMIEHVWDYAWEEFVERTKNVCG